MIFGLLYLKFTGEGGWTAAEKVGGFLGILLLAYHILELVRYYA